ncbi:T9SS type A sorting domain-containing protein [Rasiella sp. SM2506]|uniref:T9SS type A sorting domain-containing protein n=1 Tax=Rasiella sp. SM2506 TaxID=3423914 RepID=UPI003D7A2944
MKQYLLSAAFLLFSFVGFGQCPTDNVVWLQTQADVDAFAINYPNCTELNTNLIIGFNTSDINDLSGLSQLTQIGMPIGNGVTVSIAGGPNLLSLSGLENLEFIGGTFFIEDTGITNLSGLESLTNIRDSFVVTRNANLINFVGVDVLSEVGSLSVSDNISQTSFEGMEAFQGITLGLGDIQINNLESLTSLQGLNNVSKIRQLRLVGCNVLTNLDPFSNLTELGSFIIQDNESLSSINGLANADPEAVFFSLSIRDNPNLSYCSVQLLCENFDNTNPNVVIFIENNAPGCNTPQEVEDFCGVVFIPDNNFLNALLNHTPIIDTNTDGNIQFDEAEAFTGTLNLANKVISDFTGLEAFINITGFNGSGNFMSELSLESNTALTSVDFSESPDVEKIFMKNGNNTAIINFNGLDCPSLEFVCVDDVAFAQANFINIDPQVVFVEDCEVLAVEDFNFAEAVSVFPNPVSNTLTISIASNFNFIKAEVYSIGGKKLKETSAKQIDFSNFSAGIYFVKVVTERGTITKKIIKK